MVRTLALALVALAAGAFASASARDAAQCTDHATTSFSDLTEVSSRMVVPPVPSAVDNRVSVSFDLGLSPSKGFRALQTSLSYSKSSGWTLQSCGYDTKDADENGRSCGSTVHVSSGDKVKLSVHFGDTWTLSAKDETTGKESLRYITEYNAGPGKYTNAFVEMHRVNGTYHASEFGCDHLPAGPGVQFDKITVNGSPGSAWKASLDCGGSCASKVTFNDDGSSMQWSWDANGGFVV